MIVKLLTEHHVEFLGLKRRLQRLDRVYTCQNATLLEISCTGSNFYYINGKQYLPDTHLSSTLFGHFRSVFAISILLCLEQVYLSSSGSNSAKAVALW